MPNRFVQKNGSTVELLTRIPMNRGSLLKSIDNLLKTIETSENAVMIPTLLKDKVRVDACELLFVAKILKASILGHSDLVEFYMNHIGHTSSLLQQPSQALHDDLFSPVMPHQPSPLASPLLSHSASTNSFTTIRGAAADQQHSNHQTGDTNSHSHSSSTNGIGIVKQNSVSSAPSTASSTSSSMNSSASSTTTTTSGLQHNHHHQPQSQQSSLGGSGSAGGGRSSAGSNSWVTANQQLSNGNTSMSLGASFASIASSSETTTTTATTSGGGGGSGEQVGAGFGSNSVDAQLATTLNGCSLSPPKEDSAAQEALLATASKSLLVRQAQPPSLLQLTTTNNHINSMSDMFNQASQQLSPTLEQLSSNSNQTGLIQQQQQQQAPSTNGNNNAYGAAIGGTAGGVQFDASALSISTSPGNTTTLDQYLANGGHLGTASTTPPMSGGVLPNATTTAAPTPTGGRPQHPIELRSSKSAGCLFRANSGASSPRTPNGTTPGTTYPRAETLAGAASANGLVGDPKALIKLLLQVEQLKSSISHVTTLLESVVELYKKSIDNIA